MSEPTIAWQTDPSQIRMVESRLSESTEFHLVSKQKTTKDPSDWKQKRIRLIKKLHKEAAQLVKPMTMDDDVFFGMEEFVVGVSIEPHLIPEELIHFFREKPLIPFTSPEEKPEKPFEEAAYQWAKKKMIGSKQR